MGQAPQAGRVGARTGVGGDVPRTYPAGRFDLDSGASPGPADPPNDPGHGRRRLVIDQEAPGAGGDGRAGLLQ